MIFPNTIFDYQPVPIRTWLGRDVRVACKLLQGGLGPKMEYRGFLELGIPETMGFHAKII